MLHNKTNQPMEVWIVLHVAFEHGTKQQLERIRHRPYHDVSGVLFGRTHNIPRRPHGAGTYENKAHAWYEVMTHSGFYIDKAQKPRGGCKPYMIADRKWKPTHGVPNRTWGKHTDDFCGAKWGGPPCEHPEKRPAESAFVRQNVVHITNF